MNGSQVRLASPTGVNAKAELMLSLDSGYFISCGDDVLSTSSVSYNHMTSLRPWLNP